MGLATIYSKIKTVSVLTFKSLTMTQFIYFLPFIMVEI